MVTQASKPINLAQLQAELVAAGIDASRGLTSSGGDLATNATKSILTYSAGDVVDLPAGAATVITNHVAVFATPYDTPITNLQSAQSTFQADRTAIASVITSVHSADNTIQGFAGTPTLAQLATAVKSLSGAVRLFVDAQGEGDQDLANAIAATASALVALKG